jgi:hypothetical protein
MKQQGIINILLIGILHFIFIPFSKGQNDTIITMDFKSKALILPKRTLKQGDLFKVRITNLNQNVFKVNINKTDTNVTSSVSFPTFASIDLNGISDWISKLSSLTTTIPKSTSPYKNYRAETPEERAIRINKEKLIKLNDSIFKFIPVLLYFQKSLKDNTIKLDEFNFNVQKKILGYYVLDSGQFNNHLDNSIVIDSILPTVARLRSEIKHSIDSLFIKYFEFKLYTLQQIETIENTENKMKSFVDSLHKAFIGLDTLSMKVYNNLDAQKCIALIRPLINLENNNSMTYESLPMMLDSTFSILTITISPKADSTGLPSYSTFKISIPKAPKTFIGVGISFFVAGLSNDHYSIIADTANKSYNLIDEEKSTEEIGIAALLHYGVKFKKGKLDMGYAFTIGPAVSISNVIKPRLATGLGLTMGRKQMITLDVLCMTGYVDKLSKGYNTSDTYNSKPTQITVSKLSAGIAIAVGYIYKF